MDFKRLFMPVLVAGFIAGGNRVAHAQTVACSVAAPLGATSVATATGYTEPIAAGPNAVPPSAGGGMLRITCVNSGATFTAGVGAVSISLGTSITNATSHPSSAAGIRVSGGTGAFNTSGSGNVQVASVNNSSGLILIALGTTAGSGTGVTFQASSTSTFDLSGVLVSMVGKSNVSAGFSFSGSGYASNSGAIVVISAAFAGLADPTVPADGIPIGVSKSDLEAAFAATVGGGPAALKSNGTVVKGDFTIRIQENYAAMFKDSTQFNGGGVFPASPGSDVQVLVQFYNIPAGLNISGCSIRLTNLSGVTSAGNPTLSASSITAASPVLMVNFNQPLDLTNTDVLWLTCTDVTAGSASLPLAATNITAQATLAPIGAALSNDGSPLTSLTTGQTPRYAQLLQPASPLTVVSIESGQKRFSQITSQ